MRLYEKIYRIRKAKGITQAELAARMHVSRQSVSNWELGTAVPSMERLRELSKLLGVPVSCLLDDEQTVLAESAEDLENLPPPARKDSAFPRQRLLWAASLTALAASLLALALSVLALIRS